MFDIFKKDIKIGDYVKLYLTTGKEPEGIVVEIGENFVLLKNEEKKLNRFFDKLIGGWDVIENDSKEVKNAFKSVEVEINEMIRNSQFENALNQIEKELKRNNLEVKYKSSLLLKKAQIYSSNNDPDSSERAYQELVNFNEKINAPPNNLSHLYTELARLQSQNTDKLEDSIISINKALLYNPNNVFAANLLRQIESKIGKKISSELQNEEIISDHLEIESDEEIDFVSKLINVDIKEHKYSHIEIIKNDGVPTPFLAKLILEEAKQIRGVDLSERFPLYLEAAKAFSELNVGSYDSRDYQESVAYYSMLKGNSLFINFRNKIFKNELDIKKLHILRDSACSYYIESLNLLSNINPKLLLVILSNYLKITISIYNLETEKNDIEYNAFFKKQFPDLFNYCLTGSSNELVEIVLKTVINCGASSVNLWNNLAFSINKSKVYLNKIFSSEEIKTKINKILGANIDINIKPNRFLKEAFLYRKNQIFEYNNLFTKYESISFLPSNFDLLKNELNKIAKYEQLLDLTDIETNKEIYKIISIIQPYLHRNQIERTNILIQIRGIIEKQIKFINENTTYYGRTLFFSLLNKWKHEIDQLITEKITKTYPTLEIFIDPPYYLESKGEISVPIIIKNTGETTSEGFILNIEIESTVYEDKREIPYSSNIEIQVGNKIEISIVIPPDILEDANAFELKCDIKPIYQGSQLSSKIFQFTVEKEPFSCLVYEDIPWKEGPIPPEYLFKGRKKLIADLAQHYLSIEKDKPYILYGLTRTGKSSVLEYLRKNIEGDTFMIKGQEKSVITFFWDFSEASNHSNASDFYNYILSEQTYDYISKYFIKNKLEINELKIKEKVRFKDFKIILDYLENHNLYPIFFVDEFSYIKNLIDKGTISSAFLHSLRQFSLNGQASFLFAGTYDIKSLIKDPKYGITGQLVNAIEYQINEISDEAAEELIEVIKDKLTFTPEAVSHIQFLSGNVPYFIQIICKFCGYYASDNKRRYIGYPELEKVIKILIGQESPYSNSLVQKLPENIFQNNQFSPADPKEVFVLISSIVNFNKDLLVPRGVSFVELQKLWAEKKLNAFRSKLADAINILLEKRILIQAEDEGLPVYKISVDLFRRWWFVHYPDIDLILTTLTDE